MKNSRIENSVKSTKKNDGSDKNTNKTKTGSGSKNINKTQINNKSTSNKNIDRVQASNKKPNKVQATSKNTEKVQTKPNQKNKKSRSKKSKRRVAVISTTFKLLLIVVLTFILVILCSYFAELRKFNGNVTQAAMGLLKNVASAVIDEEEPVYVLLMGYSTDEGLTLTDTIILSGYNPSTQKAFMLSIPRDTFVGKNEGTANGYDKINALYTPEDASSVVETVEDLTGVDINYYVAINTDVLTEIVDVIGGVEFYVPIDMDYDDRTQDLHIHLEEGLQLIDGDKAEQLLRFRHNNDGTSYPEEYGDNDYGRMRTQREFLTEMAKQCLEVNDITTLRRTISTVFDSLETDCPLSVMFSYLTYIYDFDVDNLQTEALPGESELINEIWFFEQDDDETQDLMENILYKFNSNTPNSILDDEAEEDEESYMFLEY